MTDISSVSAVVCTLNSISSIRECLTAARESGVGELIVVDGHSTDGTLEVALELADKVVNDERRGLGFARNLGIAEAKGDYILNLGSDNVVSRGNMETMIQVLEQHKVQGVGVLTQVKGNEYLARAINIWWRARFRAGPAAVIGTPSLFVGRTLRANPFNQDRQHSDDSELCERWTRDFDAKFIICSSIVTEVGKADRKEIGLRARNYGYSDFEVYRAGVRNGWSFPRRVKSLLHPARMDLLLVLKHSNFSDSTYALPFLVWFTAKRYQAWLQTAIGR